MNRRASVVMYTVCILAAAGCVPRDRVNASCEWRGDAGAVGAPGTQARRTHLAADVRLAQELGVRYADSVVGRPPRPPLGMRDWQDAERSCTAAAMEAAARVHAREAVTQVELDALRGARDWWFDLLAIYLPGGLLFGMLSRRVARRVVADGDGDLGLPVALLIFLTPCAAVAALAGIQVWSWQAEVLRLGNDHISYRAFHLPSSRHPWLVLGAGAATFSVMAIDALRRQLGANRDVRHELPRTRAAVSLRIGRRGVTPRD